MKRLKKEPDWADYTKIKPIIIGACGGDGIGPEITKQAVDTLEFLLKDEVKSGKIEIRNIEGLTIENCVKHMKAIPDDVLLELNLCHVILKGLTTTSWKGSPWSHIDNANVAMRKELYLFANARPIRVPEKNIDWMFYIENTEGA